MTFLELLNKLNVNNVVDTLLSMYYENPQDEVMRKYFIEGYENIIKTEMAESPYKYIHLSDEENIFVILVDDNGIEYAADFVNWNEVVGLEIKHPEDLEEDEVAALILFELLFYGNRMEIIEAEEEYLIEKYKLKGRS